MIKTIHMIWMDGALPPRVVEFMLGWQKHHPDFYIWVWNRGQVLEKFPEIKELIDSSKDIRQHADIARAYILYRYGGLYIDADFECFKPLNPLMSQSFIGSEDGMYLSNGLIYCATRKNAFIKRVIERINNFDPSMEANHATGPVMYTKLFREYPHGIKVYPPEFFYPVHYDEPRILLDDANNGFAYAVHHWK